MSSLDAVGADDGGSIYIDAGTTTAALAHLLVQRSSGIRPLEVVTHSMTIAHLLAQVMGGEITVASEVGRGTRFRLRLMLASVARPKPVLAAQASAPPRVQFARAALDRNARCRGGYSPTRPAAAWRPPAKA